MELFITNLFFQPAYYISTVVSFVVSICIHEYCHAFVAHRLGDNTAKEGGFMTINPLKVMGWMSIAALLLFGFSWGAVPVKSDDPRRLRRAAISLAGPLSNFVLLCIVALLLKWLYAIETEESSFIYYLRLFLITTLYANAILFLFNILPIPTLDGWGTIEPFLPKSLIPSEDIKRTLFRIFIYIVCFSSASGLFDKAVEMIVEKFLPQQINSNYTQGMEFYENKDYKNAVEFLHKAAEQGHADAQNNLGWCYKNGFGVEKNDHEAVKWYQKAAEQGHAVAQENLALCYENGEGVEKDVGEAVKWFRKAAEQGSDTAQNSLGWCYENGEGVEKNDHEAVKWYRKAAEQGYAVAQHNLGWCYEKGEGVEKDVHEAVKWFRKAAEQGFDTAQNSLGWCYQSGEGVEKDFHEAVKWYRKAAEQGHADAQNSLGWCYQSGVGVEKDAHEAVKWFRKAAEQGHAVAQINLGWCYKSGEGVEKDVGEAVKWYQKAADQGDANAKKTLENLDYRQQ